MITVLVNAITVLVQAYTHSPPWGTYRYKGQVWTLMFLLFLFSGAPTCRSYVPMEYQIEVTLIFPDSVDIDPDATLYVRLQDITYADAPGVLVAEAIIQPVLLQPGGIVPATLRVPEARITPTALYSVRAHVDMDADERVSIGDWVSTQVHPVLTRGHPTRVTVPLTLVR